MAGRITIRVQDEATRRMLNRIARAMTPGAQRAVLTRVAWITHARLVRQTPKRWTGQTRRDWKVVPRTDGSVAVTNESKVMGWLERGTRSHGPTRAQKLFVPLTRRAAQAGPRGVMYANRQHQLNQAFGVTGTRRRPPFVHGVDFVFTRRVRGIRALRIAERQAVFAKVTLRSAMTQWLRSVVKGG